MLVINPIILLWTDPYKFIGHREGIRYISTHQQKNSSLYIHSSIVPFIQYYEHLFTLPNKRIYNVDIRDSMDSCDAFKRNIEAEFDSLKNKTNVWIIINKSTPIHHQYFNNRLGFEGCTNTEFETIEPIIRQKAKVLLSFQNQDTACYLCDFKRDK